MINVEKYFKINFIILQIYNVSKINFLARSPFVELGFGTELHHPPSCCLVGGAKKKKINDSLAPMRCLIIISHSSHIIIKKIQ